MTSLCRGSGSDQDPIVAFEWFPTSVRTSPGPRSLAIYLSVRSSSLRFTQDNLVPTTYLS